MTASPWQFRLLLVHTLLVQSVTFVVRPTTSYRALELGVAEAALGALSAGFALVPLALALGVGRMTDRWGERWVILLGGVVMVAATVLLLTSSGLAGLLAGTALLGLGHLLSMVGEQALVANTSSNAGRDSRFGYYTFAASAGQVAGPGLISLFDASSTFPDTRALFVLGLVLAVVGVLVGVPLRRSPTGQRGADTPTGGARRLLRTPGLFRALLASSVVLAAVDISLAYFPALGQERGYDAALISGLLVVRAAASMVSRLLLGTLAGLVGRRRLLLGCVVGSAATFAVLAVPLTPPFLFAVVALAGLALGVGQPLTMSWVAGMAPVHLRGTAMSLRITGNRLGQVTIPAVAGLAAAGMGAGGVFAATGALLAVAALAVRRLPMDEPPRD